MDMFRLLLLGLVLPAAESPQLHQARAIGVIFLGSVLLLLLLLCAWRAPHSRRPAVVWGVGGYFSLLHVIGIYGLLTSTQFETAFATLTLATFPWCMAVANVLRMHSFGTLHNLGANYIRYILVFGGLNAVLIGVFFAFLVPARPGRSMFSR